ncbi:MAG: hypothetical protein KAV82_07775 [Phycisphaerae bacterium]|nr:hypothetical protein [Phycisphaerae bacterium]
MDQQRDEIVEALLAYAKREGVTTVVGSEKEARISERVDVLLPRKTAGPGEVKEKAALLGGLAL